MEKNDDLLVATTNDLPGYHYHVLGEVFGVSTVTKSFVGNYLASIKGIIGGHVNSYTKLQIAGRDSAMKLLRENAERMGASAVIGMRYDSNALDYTMLSVTAYGTAIVIDN